MADRLVRIITKQTSVPGRIPTGTTGSEDNFIRQGEIAQNTYDRKIFGYNGTSVFEFGTNTFLNLSGGTISGNTRISGAISADTIYSGSTNLYDIFATSAGLGDITRIQPGLNTYTGGTANEPTINISAATLSSLSATTISGGTLYSGSTNLYSIFSTTDTNDITRIQPGSNITTGGTVNEPTISLVDSPSISGLTASGTVRSALFKSTEFFKGYLMPTYGYIGTGFENGFPTASDTYLSWDAGNLSIVTPSANQIVFSRVGSSQIVLNTSGGITNNLNENTSVFQIRPQDTNSRTAFWNKTLQNRTGVNFLYGTESTAVTANFHIKGVGTTISEISEDITSALVVDGISAGTSTYALKLRNNLLSNLLTVRDDGLVSITTALTATTISGGTLYSGNTNLYSIFSTTDTNDITRVQPGSNIATGGTENLPSISIVASPSFNNIVSSGISQLNTSTVVNISGGTISAGTIYSGYTNLYDIFITTAGGGTPFGSDYEIQLNSGGTFYSKSNFIYDYDSDNFSVGGVATFGPLSSNNSNLNAISSAFGSNSRNSLILGGELHNLTATDSVIIGGHNHTIDSSNSSGATILGGFNNRIDAQNSSIIGGINNFINTGLTGVVVAGTSGVTASTSYSFYSQNSYLAHQGGVIYSAGTNLYDIFVSGEAGNDITRVQPGLNIYTGGTANEPTINISAATLSSLSATTVSGGTLYSGSTNLYSIFSTTDTNDITRVQPGSNISTGGTGNLPSISIVASPSLSSLTLSGTNAITASNNTASLSVANFENTNNGAAAQQRISATNNQGYFNAMSIFSDGFTPSGLNQPNLAKLINTSPAGLLIQTNISTASTIFSIGLATTVESEIMRLTSSGLTMYSGTVKTGGFVATGDSVVNSLTAGTLYISGFTFNSVIGSSATTANSAQSLDSSLTNYWEYVLSANTTFTFSNTQPGQQLTIAVSQPTNNSGLTVTFSAITSTLKWQGGLTPTMSTTSGRTDIYSFLQLGNNMYGVYSQNFF